MQPELQTSGQRTAGDGAPSSVRTVAPRPPEIPLAALRVPLVVKLIGANAFVVVAFVAMWGLSAGSLATPVLAGAAVAVGLHAVLVLVALRPIRELEAVANRVWRGDYGARVAKSLVADRNALRVGAMFNILLDGLSSDRERLQVLAADVIAAGDKARAALSHELHDSIAQHLAALLLQLGALARDARDPGLAERLAEARTATAAILETIRLLSQTVYPLALNDLGLEAALRKLARDASSEAGVAVDVTARGLVARVSAQIEGLLFHIAEEAVRNALRHGRPAHIRINVHRDASSVTLDIHDDGTGFAPDGVEAQRRGLGLRAMRERVSVVDGVLEVKSVPGAGTTVSAVVPLDIAAGSLH